MKSREKASIKMKLVSVHQLTPADKKTYLESDWLKETEELFAASKNPNTQDNSLLLRNDLITNTQRDSAISGMKLSEFDNATLDPNLKLNVVSVEEHTVLYNIS